MKKQGEIRVEFAAQLAKAIENYVLHGGSFDVVVSVRSCIGIVFGYGSDEYEAARHRIEAGRRLKCGQPLVGGK